MEERLRAVEDRLLKLEVKSDTFATKADVVEAKNSIILWVVGVIVVWGSTIVGATLCIAHHAH